MVDAVPVMDVSVNGSDLESPLEGNRFAALGDSGSAQGAPIAETVRQRRRMVLVFDPLAEGEVGGQESEADTESLPWRFLSAPSTATRFPWSVVCAQDQGHSPVWTQLISTKFSNCGQE